MRRRFAVRSAVLLVCLAAVPVIPADYGLYEQDVFRRVNAVRARHNLLPLVWDEKIGRAARSHSERMVKEHFFGHMDPHKGDVASRLTHAGVAWREVGENVYRETGYVHPAESAVDGWMESRGHRENMLHAPYKSTGIGVAKASDGTFYFTQMFVR